MWATKRGGVFLARAVEVRQATGRSDISNGYDGYVQISHSSLRVQEKLETDRAE